MTLQTLIAQLQRLKEDYVEEQMKKEDCIPGLEYQAKARLWREAENLPIPEFYAEIEEGHHILFEGFSFSPSAPNHISLKK